MSEKPYKPMTRYGFTRLADEFNQLRNVERPKVVQGVADAAAEGDRSENAEYIYGKKRLREIDKRLGYLTNLLDGIQVVDPEKISATKVVFGATVHVQDENGHARKFMLVGVGEAEAEIGRISWQSPVGKALLNKKVGDLVQVNTPAGVTEYEVVSLEFKP